MNSKKMFTTFFSLVITLVVMPFIGFVSCSPDVPKSISAFVGSASKPPMEEAAKIFREKTGIKVDLTFGGSGGVLSQMKLAKSGDLYIPGSPDYIAIAERDGVIEPGSDKIIAYLIPAIVVQSGNPKNIRSLSDMANPGFKIGIGNPESVCVGLYAIEILERNNLLEAVGKNIVTYASSCDNTASIVALKAVDAVMGWEVFHAWDPKTMDAVFLKPEQIPRIAYIPVSISKFCKDKESANKFMTFLISPEGQKIFSKAGYNVTESEARKFAPNALTGGEYKLPANYKPLVK
jgi:molybdate transport system substrate-binding protein